MIQKKYIDQLGRSWYGARIIQSNVPVEEGDWILFNEELGFQISLGHVFGDQFRPVVIEDDPNPYDIDAIIVNDPEK